VAGAASQQLLKGVAAFMSVTPLLPLVLWTAGLSLVLWSASLRSRERRRQLAALLELPSAEDPSAGESSRDAPPGGGVLAERAVAVAGKAVARFDPRGSLAFALEQARIPLRPGEYVIVTIAAGLTSAALILGLTGQVLLGAVALTGAPLVARFVVRHRRAKWRKAFEAQLPDALTLVSSSLAAGHTFLRAIQMMCEESPPPLSDEFGRLVSETRLGDPLVEALGRMADRLKIRDLDWVVQAIRIQQTVGGRLADLLNTLSDFIRARDEIRKEVSVLTAEGRISAYVLAGLVPFLLLTIQVMNPGYMAPLYRGWGIFILIGSGGSVLMGTAIILRMVKIDV
jgi:tight adherence protein B